MTDEVSVQANSAVYYEKRYSGWGLKYHKVIVDWMMEGIWPDQKVLDAGCGTGIISRLYPNYMIAGMDISPEMVSRCPVKWIYFYDKNNVPSATWMRLHVTGDVCLKSITADETTDAIVCRSLLHHLPDHKLALAEFHRVLKPGGKLVCWEPSSSWLVERVRNFTQHGDRFSHVHHSFKPCQIVKDLEESGFKVEEIRHMGFLAYPLWGFRDIIDFQKYVPFKPILFPLTMALDYLLESIPWLNRMSWAVGIRATKV